jgi:hypothetical protein
MSAVAFFVGVALGTPAGLFLAAVLTAGKVADVEMERDAYLRALLTHMAPERHPRDDGARLLSDIADAVRLAEYAERGAERL